jgi:hypothetical protein
VHPAKHTTGQRTKVTKNGPKVSERSSQLELFVLAPSAGLH